MKVLKFGGTSVGSAKGLECIKEIVDKEKGALVVVVSALGGITDQLITVANLALSNDPTKDYKTELEKIKNRHTAAIEQSISNPTAQQKAMSLIQPMLSELEALLLGISLVGELSSGTLALVVSYGERMSSVIVSHMLDGAQHLDSTKIFRTIPYFERNILDYPSTIRNIRCEMGHLTHKCSDQIIVIGGFISSDLSSGRITNLGRGGSDFTASIVASTLGARLLEIYTDVDGFMTADPRIAPKAKLLNTLGFIQAMELCNFGAKVLYAPTIFPAYNHNIPIRIKNTFNHTCSGTFIDSSSSSNAYEVCKPTLNDIKGIISNTNNHYKISGISSIKDTALISISSTATNAPGHRQGVRWMSYRLSKALSRNGISPSFQSISEDDKTLDIGILETSSEIVVEILSQEFAQEIAMEYIAIPKICYGLSTLAIVGESIDDNVRTSILAHMQKMGINPVRIAPNSQRSISMIVESSRLKESIQYLHTLFFEQEHQHIDIKITNINGFDKYIELRNESLITSHNIRFVPINISPEQQSVSDSMTIKHESEKIKIELIHNPKDGSITLNNDLAMSLGVEPMIKQILNNFNDNNDQIENIEAVLPSSSIDMAISRATMLAKWANIIITEPVIMDSSTKNWTEQASPIMNATKNIQNNKYIRIELNKNDQCKIQPHEPNLSNDLADCCKNEQIASTNNCYISILSKRFNNYPLHVWLKELSFDTIYRSILELVV